MEKKDRDSGEQTRSLGRVSSWWSAVVSSVTLSHAAVRAVSRVPGGSPFGWRTIEIHWVPDVHGCYGVRMGGCVMNFMSSCHWSRLIWWVVALIISDSLQFPLHELRMRQVMQEFTTIQPGWKRKMSDNAITVTGSIVCHNQISKILTDLIDPVLPSAPSQRPSSSEREMPGLTPQGLSNTMWAVAV